jgi:two-component system cell cycle response regulator CpdR
VKLILLEDDPLILLCTQDALAEAGFEVHPAVSGSEALQLLSDTPDCLLLMVDVRLAQPPNGWEVARRARSARPDVAIIYTTTAEGSVYERERVDRSVLLQKPYTLDRAISAACEACVKVGRVPPQTTG